MTSYIMLCPNCYTHFIRPPPTHTHTHTHTVTKTYKNNKYVESIRYRKICCTITNIEYNPISTPKLLLGFRTIGPSDYWAFVLSGLWTIGPSDYRAFGLLSLWTIGLSDYRTFGPTSPKHTQKKTTRITHTLYPDQAFYIQPVHLLYQKYYHI